MDLDLSFPTKIIVNKEKYPKMDADDPKCSLCLDFFTPPVRITSCGQGFSKTVFMMGTWQLWLPQLGRVQNVEQSKIKYQ